MHSFSLTPFFTLNAVMGVTSSSCGRKFSSREKSFSYREKKFSTFNIPSWYPFDTVLAVIPEDSAQRSPADIVILTESTSDMTSSAATAVTLDTGKQDITSENTETLTLQTRMDSATRMKTFHLLQLLLKVTTEKLSSNQ